MPWRTPASILLWTSTHQSIPSVRINRPNPTTAYICRTYLRQLTRFKNTTTLFSSSLEMRWLTTSPPLWLRNGWRLLDVISSSILALEVIVKFRLGTRLLILVSQTSLWPQRTRWFMLSHSDENRLETAHYMNCGTDDSRVDFFAFNDYSWCNPSTFTTSTWADKVKAFGDYSIPIL